MIYEIYAGAVGPEELIVRASRYGALKYIHHENLKKRLLGIERPVFESRESTEEPQEGEIPAIFDLAGRSFGGTPGHAGRWRSVWRGRFLNAWKKSIKNMDEVKRELLKKTKTMWKQHRAGINGKAGSRDKISLTKTVMNG